MLEQRAPSGGPTTCVSQKDYQCLRWIRGAGHDGAEGGRRRLPRLRVLGVGRGHFAWRSRASRRWLGAAIAPAAGASESRRPGTATCSAAGAAAVRSSAVATRIVWLSCLESGCVQRQNSEAACGSPNSARARALAPRCCHIRICVSRNFGEVPIFRSCCREIMPFRVQPIGRASPPARPASTAPTAPACARVAQNRTATTASVETAAAPRAWTTTAAPSASSPSRISRCAACASTTTGVAPCAR